MNMIMASRLVYGMACQRVVPSMFANVHPARGTPWVAIRSRPQSLPCWWLPAISAAWPIPLCFLLLCVFALVNVSVLVLRRDRVDHEHFRAPTWMPILGALVCLILALPITGRDTAVYVRVGVLIAIGVVLWFVNRLCIGKVRQSMQAK